MTTLILYEEARFYKKKQKYKASRGYIQAPEHERLKYYNGCGPKWFPEKLRDKLTKWLELFEECFKIHDWDFTKLPKTEYFFKQANKRFDDNLTDVVKKTYSWYNWKRYRGLLVVKWLVKAVKSDGGWSAFLQG